MFAFPVVWSLEVFQVFTGTTNIQLDFCFRGQRVALEPSRRVVWDVGSILMPTTIGVRLEEEAFSFISTKATKATNQ